MKFLRAAFRSLNGGVSHQCGYLSSLRSISTNTAPESGTENKSSNSSESADDFERRIFGGFSGNNQDTDSFYQKLDRLGKARGRVWFGSNSSGSSGEGGDSQPLDGLDESFSTLSDGLDGKLKNAAKYFEINDDEVLSDDYSFRPDMVFKPPMVYDTKDLDLTKPGVNKPYNRPEFEVTTEEVLRKADFRNVRFLQNFITEAGIIIKRSQTRISAKAQRKVAREIKTARAFGLMPFTTMGQYKFEFGKSREDRDEEDDYDNYIAQDRFNYIAQDRFVDPVNPVDLMVP